MKIKPFCSVLMPVYNVEDYVADAIYSILNQTVSDIELVVIDDASTDSTYQIVKQIARKETRIKLLKNNENLKIASSLNKGLSVANGEYIVRMDGDDISDSDRIETLL